MGFEQTATHVVGEGSYHQIGLVRGQFGSVDREIWLQFLEDKEFDGYEEAGWELDLPRCDTDEGAEAYARELVDAAKKHKLQIFTIAAHLQGQVLGDEPSAKTLQFIGGKAAKMYVEWYEAGNNPPRENPLYVPPEVGQEMHKQAKEDLVRIGRLAEQLGKLQNRQVPVSGFVGSPAGRWNNWFLFPPLPKEIIATFEVEDKETGGKKEEKRSVPVPDVNKTSAELLIGRFGPVWDDYKQRGVKFGLECHPSEFAMGDITSAQEFLDVVDAAGYSSVVGFNLDGSHMEWQGVSVIEFVRHFHARIWSVHLKGVQVAKGYTKNGRLGGHRPMGDSENGWNFVTPGSSRDIINNGELIVELNRVGYDGALNIEWEDNDAEMLAGAADALLNIRKVDLPPSFVKHDEALKAAV